jgi:hypothetical protein
MKKLLISWRFSFSAFYNAQNITSKKWSDVFSYNNVLAMKEDNGKIVAATENGIFIIIFQQEKLINFLKLTDCMKLKFQLSITILKPK